MIVHHQPAFGRRLSCGLGLDPGHLKSMFLAHVTCATCLAKGAVRDKRRDDFLRALKAKGSETAAIDAEIGATVFTELWDDLSPS